MSEPRLQKLQYKNYLSAIKALPQTNLFRHLYVADENGREFDATDDGDRSCALAVTAVLYLAGWIDRPHATVASTLKALAESGWRKTESPRPGDIVHYPAGESGDEHVGFWVGDDAVISNISELRTPGEHKLMMSDGRLPMGYYTRDYGVDLEREKNEG